MPLKYVVDVLPVHFEINRQTVAFFKIAEGRHTVLIDWICTFIGKLFFHYTHTTPQFSNIPNWQQNIPKNILTKPN